MSPLEKATGRRLAGLPVLTIPPSHHGLIGETGRFGQLNLERYIGPPSLCFLFAVRFSKHVLLETTSGVDGYDWKGCLCHWQQVCLVDIGGRLDIIH